jgi:inhibitor of cysteine peptidase
MASDEEVRVKAGETFTLRLPAVPTAGYEWQETHDPATLELVRGGEFSPGASDAPGAGSEEAFTFRARAPGETVLELHYGREWEPQPREVRRVRVVVED